MYDLAARAGLRFAQIGLESVSTTRVEAMGKWPKTDALTLADYREVFRFLSSRGIMVGGVFVLGYPGERMSERWTLVRHARRVCHKAGLTLYRPVPGTAAHDQAKQSGQLKGSLFYQDLNTYAIAGTPTLVAEVFVLRLLFALDPRQILYLFSRNRMIRSTFRKFLAEIGRSAAPADVGSLRDFASLVINGFIRNTPERYHDEMQMRYTSPRFLNRLARAAGVRGEPLP